MIMIADEIIRIDKFISDELEEIAREKIKDFIKDKLIKVNNKAVKPSFCLLYTSPSPRDGLLSRMPSSA